MLATILALPGLLAGLFGTINGLTAAISNEKIAALTATTQQEQIAANERVATLQQRRDVLIADAAHGSWDIWIRTTIALGPTIYLFKIFAIDKVIGPALGYEWSTDRLDPNLWQVVMVVLGFYFLSETSTKVARIFAARK
jgi:hypothetical protein